MTLQVQSIWLVGALTAFTYGGLMLILRRSYPDWLNSAMTYGGVANLLVAASYMLRIGYFFPSEWFIFVFGNTAATLCLCMELRAIAELKSKSVSRWKVFVSVPIIFVSTVLFVLVWRNIAICQLVFNLVNFGILLTTVFVLLDDSFKKMMLADRAALVSFSLLATSTLAVAVSLLSRLASPVEYHFSEPLALYNIIASIIASNLISAVFLLMVGERLSMNLRTQALRDSLTGIYNRRAFEEIVEREIATARRTGQPFSLLICDIDDFKRVNDTYGHLTGDELLIKVTSMLASCLREEDSLCRWGGDEFLAILPRAGADQARGIGQRIRTYFQQAPVALSRIEMVVGVSLGTATAQGSALELTSILHEADMAMYKAKQMRRAEKAVFTA